MNTRKNSTNITSNLKKIHRNEVGESTQVSGSWSVDFDKILAKVVFAIVKYFYTSYLLTACLYSQKARTELEFGDGSKLTQPLSFCFVGIALSITLLPALHSDLKPENTGAIIGFGEFLLNYYSSLSQSFSVSGLVVKSVPILIVIVVANNFLSYLFNNDFLQSTHRLYLAGHLYFTLLFLSFISLFSGEAFYQLLGYGLIQKTILTLTIFMFILCVYGVVFVGFTRRFIHSADLHGRMVLENVIFLMVVGGVNLAVYASWVELNVNSKKIPIHKNEVFLADGKLISIVKGDIFTANISFVYKNFLSVDYLGRLELNDFFLSFPSQYNLGGTVLFENVSKGGGNKVLSYFVVERDSVKIINKNINFPAITVCEEISKIYPERNSWVDLPISISYSGEEVKGRVEIVGLTAAALCT